MLKVQVLPKGLSSGNKGAGNGFSRLSLNSISLLAGMAFVFTACSIPQHMQVRSGVDPRNQDDDVRFRTTYYFRTFDACFEIQVPSDQDVARQVTGKPFYIRTTGRYKPITDSVYRFRMTGKANDLFSSVHFEAGSLKASEIDPFGASIDFDEKNRQFRFVSREETEKRARRKRIYDEIDKLDAMAFRVSARNGAAARPNTGMLDGIEKRMAALWRELSATDGISVSNTSPSGQSTQCPANTVARRGFQILGPEGWRTFNQDERLVLAMSISGKPLISALKDLSGRVLKEQNSPNDALLKLARERINILEAKRVLKRLRIKYNAAAKKSVDPTKRPEPPTPKEIREKVVAAFSTTEE